MQTKAGRAFVSASSEEGIERLSPNVRAHTATIIGYHDLDTLISERVGPEADRSGLSFRKCMDCRIENEVAEHQPVGPRQTIHDEIGLTRDIERNSPLAPFRPQPDQHLLVKLAEIEVPPF